MEELKDDYKKIQEELNTCKASLASIHYHSQRIHDDQIGMIATMMSITDECEHAVPELKKLRGMS